MPLPPLPKVHELVDDLANRVINSEPSASSFWAIRGPATGGKSTALLMLADRLKEEGFHPILLAPPMRALDTGPKALVQGAVGLRQHGLINGQFDQIHAEGPWSEKLDAWTTWMDDARERLVLLCDEPGSWPATSPEDVHFRQHAQEVSINALATLNCRRVVAGRLPTGLRPSHTLTLALRSAPADWLPDASHWGPLVATATELAGALGTQLVHRSPLEIRLLVAIATLRSVDEVSNWFASQPSRREISRKLAWTLRASNGRTEAFLRKGWSVLALSRDPVDEQLVETLVGKAPSKRALALLRNCLLYPDGQNFVLHWSLRLDAREHRIGWRDINTADVHRQFATYHRDRFQRRMQDGDPSALLDEMEAFFHATRAGDQSLLDQLRPFFADQLDALGRTLSRDFKRNADAARVFARACKWEPGDDYAHHYLAYNLDVLAQRAAEVEDHYQEAIKLYDTHVWWHSRWISYLVTRGRTDAAGRAWTDALDALGLPDADADQWVYENLHLWVARLLVHRGQLDFAEDVMRAIPADVLARHPGLAAIERRLKALLDARRTGSVFPLWLRPEDWWCGRPHLCPLRGDKGETLTRWMPARVDELSEHEVHLLAAHPPEIEQDEPTYGSIDIPAGDFDRWSRDDRVGALSAGRFVELAWYGDQEEPVIRVHRDGGWEDPDLPPLFPDPARYLRAAGWVRSAQ
ncbi:MAG: tetratricopeptide repeat protein [Oligoflexia bacterium]|nr:tetratricopeptide repeat protein [Oligoflexia bacterium]